MPQPSIWLTLLWAALTSASTMLAVLWWLVWRATSDVVALVVGWAMLALAGAFGLNAVIRTFGAPWAYELIAVQRAALVIAVVMVWLALSFYIERGNSRLHHLRWARFPWIHRGT